MNFIPDPHATKNGNYTSQDYRYFGFVRQTSIYELIDSGIYEKDGIKKVIQKEKNPEMEQTNQAYNTSGNYNDIVQNLNENFSVTIYYHYTQL